MISTVSFSFDLTYTNPVTGALQPRGIVVDSTDYIGLGLSPLIYELKGLGQVTFNGDIIVDLNTVGTPMIDIQNWDYVNDGVPTYTFDLPLDLNGNVANGVYTFIYRLRVNSFTIPVAATITPPDLVNVASNQWITQYLEIGNVIRLADPGVDFEDVTVEALTQVGANAEITVTDYTIAVAEIILFDLQNVQFNAVYAYSGCTQVNADVSFTYDCEVGDNGTWAVANTTPLAANEVVANLNCTINYPSWATLSPTFPGNVVVTSLPYPSAPNTETPLATGTYTVSLTQQIQQTQASGLVVLYSKSVAKEFVVSCAGTLCGLVPCIENLRAAHQAELLRNRISKYQVYVDNVLMYYIEALNYKACGEITKYRDTLKLLEAQLDASGCDCACCDDQSYYWVSNNSGVSVIEGLIQAFQFRLFDGIPGITEDVTQGVEVGALWQDYNTGILYRCTDNTEGAAVWVEYYAPGTDPDASEIPATPGSILSANDVQGQLTLADTQFAFQILQNAQFNGDISAVESDLAALTASDVAATPGTLLSDPDVQGQLTQADTRFALQILENAQFSGDISTLQSTALTSVAVDGTTIEGDGTVGDPLSVIPVNTTAIFRISQTGTNNPALVQTVYNNTGEAITLLRSAQGVYRISLGAEIGTTKTAVTISNGANNGQVSISPNAGFALVNTASPAGVASDSILSNATVEIKLY
jgi:hypothetical protein